MSDTKSVEALEAELSQAQNELQNIDEEVSTARKQRKKKKRKHEKTRAKLIQKKLEEAEMTWCSDCGELVSRDETALVITCGKEEYPHGYQDSMYGFREFSKLYRMCRQCRQKAFEKHGWVGGYDSIAEDRPRFYIITVDDFEHREDGLYIQKFGAWKKFGGQNRLNERRREAMRQIKERWDIPPKLAE